MIRLLALVVTGAVALPAAPLVITTPIPVTGSATLDRGGMSNGGLSFRLSNASGTADTLFALGSTTGEAYGICFDNLTGCSVIGSFGIDGVTLFSGGFARILFPDEFSSDGRGALFLYDTSNQLIASAVIQGFWTNVVTTTIPGCTFALCGDETRFDIVPNPPAATPEPSALICMLLCSTVLATVRKRIVPSR